MLNNYLLIMNINVYSRLVSSCNDINAFGLKGRFTHVFDENARNTDIYRKQLASDVQLFYNGMNISVIVLGDQCSSKQFTVFGNENSCDGILTLFLQQLFCCSGQQRQSYNKKSFGGNVALSWYQVDDEKIIDVLSQKDCLTIDENPEDGCKVSDLSKLLIYDGHATSMILKSNLSKMNKNMVSFIEVTLVKPPENGMLATKSKFTMVILPVETPLSEEITSGLSIRGDGCLDQSLLCFSQLAACLANMSYPERVVDYEGSKVTTLMKDLLGGNSKTSALFCLKNGSGPALNTTLLELASTLARIQNYPIVNTELAQKLICQYRSQILQLKKSSWPDVKKIPKLIPSNFNTHCSRVKTAEISKACHVCHSDKCCELTCKIIDEDTDLNDSEFGMSCFNNRKNQSNCAVDEEKELSILEMINTLKVENETLHEEKSESCHQFYVDKKQLEHRTKLLEQESQESLALMNAEKHEKLKVQKELEYVLQEYNDLSCRYERIYNSYKQQVTRIEDHKNDLQSLFDFPSTNLQRLTDRINNLMEQLNSLISTCNFQITQISERTEKCLPPRPCTPHQENDLKIPFLAHEKILNNLKDENQDLNQELISAKKLSREVQKKVAKLSARLIILERNRTYIGRENNRLQNQLKEMTYQFKKKLLKYMSKKLTCGSSHVSGINVVLDDLKQCHVEREKQLISAATFYKEQLDDILSNHEKLLAAYRDIYEQAKSKNLVNTIDLALIEEYLKVQECPVERTLCDDHRRSPDIVQKAYRDQQERHNRSLSLNAKVRDEIKLVQDSIKKSLEKINSRYEKIPSRNSELKLERVREERPIPREAPPKRYHVNFLDQLRSPQPGYMFQEDPL